MKMAEGYGFEPDVESPPFQLLGERPPRLYDRDVEMMAAVAKVASSNALCLALMEKLEATGTDLPAARPRCRALEMADIQRRSALVELSNTPATSSDDCFAKLNVLTEMLAAYGREDPEMVDRLLEYAHEATALIQKFEADKPVMGGWRKTLVNSRSIRRIMGIAFAFSSAVVGRMDVGGLN
jgi:hypothetical protein